MNLPSWLYIRSPIAKILIGIVSVLITLVVVLLIHVTEEARMELMTDSWAGREIENGAALFANNCASCHGMDGKMPEDMKPMGALAKGNPWENLHKLLNGQPAEEMPALRALDIQVAVDILRYTQDLPEK